MLKRLIAMLVLAGIGLIIFNFSSQTYEQQTIVPHLQRFLPGEPFAGVLSQIEVSYWGQPVSVETKGYYYFIEFLIRKLAHVVLFGALAVALFAVLVMGRPRRLWPVALLSLAATSMYAVTDEYHQLLTGGRTPMLKDVALDTVGAVLALAIVVPSYALYRRYQKKRRG